MTPSSDQPSVQVLATTCIVRSRAEAISVDKGDGTQVDYYLFPEYEIHTNVVAPGTVQGWHHHTVISETLIVTAGSIEAHWVDDGQHQTRTLTVGDVLEVGSSSHTIANPFDTPAQFLVFRFVPDGVNKQDRIKNDKHPDDPPPS